MRELFGEPIQDAYEETFTVFSHTLPSNNLGSIDNTASEVEVEIGARPVIVKQSPGLLVSQRKAGTTGAVLWKITPLLAQWLVSMPTVLQEADILSARSNIVELGCGVTGLIGISLAPFIATYILTDQSYVGKKVQENITANTPLTTAKRKVGKAPASTGTPKFSDLDWETDTPSKQTLYLDQADSIDLVIACDCVYNDYLIVPLVQTMIDLCQLQAAASTKQTAVLIAQQLRSEVIFEDFITALLKSFHVWRIPNDHLPKTLQTGSGYAVHIAWLKGRLHQSQYAMPKT